MQHSSKKTRLRAFVRFLAALSVAPLVACQWILDLEPNAQPVASPIDAAADGSLADAGNERADDAPSNDASRTDGSLLEPCPRWSAGTHCFIGNCPSPQEILNLGGLGGVLTGMAAIGDEVFFATGFGPPYVYQGAPEARSMFRAPIRADAGSPDVWLTARNTAESLQASGTMLYWTERNSDNTWGVRAVDTKCVSGCNVQSIGALADRIFEIAPALDGSVLARTEHQVLLFRWADGAFATDPPVTWFGDDSQMTLAIATYSGALYALTAPEMGATNTTLWALSPGGTVSHLAEVDGVFSNVPHGSLAADCEAVRIAAGGIYARFAGGVLQPMGALPHAPFITVADGRYVYFAEPFIDDDSGAGAGLFAATLGADAAAPQLLAPGYSLNATHFALTEKYGVVGAGAGGNNILYFVR